LPVKQGGHPSPKLAVASGERNDTAEIAVDSRPGGPVVKTSAQPGRAGNQ
jgi:hypothetical protein